MTDSRQRIETLSVRTLDSGGSAVLAETGDAIMDLARTSRMRTRLGIDLTADQDTGVRTVLWSRRLRDGEHAMAVSPWANRSYMLQDLRMPRESDPGFLRAYLFGSDQAVTGLEKACRVIRIQDISSVPGRMELSDLIADYRRSVSPRSRRITSGKSRGTFVRLIRSIIDK